MVLPVEQPVGLASNLPGHLLTRIFLALDFKSKLQAELTCRHWHKVLASPEVRCAWLLCAFSLNPAQMRCRVWLRSSESLCQVHLNVKLVCEYASSYRIPFEQTA